MRTLPAPENGDEIVAGPIAEDHYFANTSRILSVCATRARQYYLYIVSITK
jgi:hypothetical protein